MQLRTVDLEGVLSFLGDVSDIDFEVPYPIEVVARLQVLVPCDEATYQVADLRRKEFRSVIGIGPEEDEVEEAVYWEAGACPISEYRVRTGDLSAVRMSDLMSMRRYHELPIYRDYFRPCRVDHMIDLALPAGGGQHRSFILFRRTGARGFSERDREVLDTLRPHLAVLEQRAFLRQQVRRAGCAPAEEPPGRIGLTSREREIVQLVAEGKTNAEIAAELWVAPSTVKKHLEHVYEKLGVGRRIAAASLVAGQSRAVPQPSPAAR